MPTGKPLQLVGQVFGRLTVLEFAGTNARHHSMWLCLCECGNSHVAIGKDLNYGDVKSCGCLKKELDRTHGDGKVGSISPEYQSWHGMKTRCLNPNASNYELYGGRGITICARWLEPECGYINFRSDMGPRPLGTSINRIDNDGNYTPENCEWATAKTQNNNRRNSRKKVA